LHQAFVLIVDDDADVCAFCRRILLAAGYAVGVASDGEVGLGLAGSRFPDVILLDHYMPRLGGRGFLDRLEGTGRPRPKIVAMSRLGGPEVEAFGRRADRFLPKPFTAGALLGALSSILDEG
jgi:CheY-like chemotaxis protein